MDRLQSFQQHTWAVHRLHGKLLVFALEEEHVLAIVLQVAGLRPQVSVEHVGGDDLLEAALTVLGLNETKTGNESWMDEKRESMRGRANGENRSHEHRFHELATKFKMKSVGKKSDKKSNFFATHTRMNSMRVL
jgi:hypothetical protein